MMRSYLQILQDSLIKKLELLNKIEKNAEKEYNKRRKKVRITMNRKHNSISGKTVQVHLSVL